MIQKTKYIFIFIFICSVFSLALQASVIHICKESKVFKSQNQQKPIAEEEEGAHEGDELPDEETLYLYHQHFYFSTLAGPNLMLSNLVSSIQSCYFKIPSPPPKY